MGGVVSAHYLQSAGGRLVGGDTSRGGDGGEKRGGSRDLIPLTIPEVRRLLLLLTQAAETREQGLHWSHWRRRHQARARRSHYARWLRRHSP